MSASKHLFGLTLAILCAASAAQAQVAYQRNPGGQENYHMRSGVAPVSPEYQTEQNYQPQTAPVVAQAQAQPQKGSREVRIFSGTGFFVSNRGHLITNEHVVRGCDTVTVRGAVSPIKAKVLRVDAENDLALLQADTVPGRVATLRQEEDALRRGDPVMVMGYPKEHGMTGVYAIAEASILDLKGPQEEPRWIQFTDSAQQGNSGGPLLDGSGNVVGVVVGKAKLIEFDRKSAKERTVKESDLAISLPVVKKFLYDNRVMFRTASSRGYFPANRIENNARYFIVNVHCPADNGQVVSR